eukprot:2111521-Rhodomonas_salina.1
MVPEAVTELLLNVWERAKISANKEREALLAYVKKLQSYEDATECPVLTQHMVLRIRYGVSGTDVAYGATRPRGRTALVRSSPGTGTTPPVLVSTSGYLSRRHPCITIILRRCYAMSGTCLWYRCMLVLTSVCCPTTRACPGTDVAYAATLLLRYCDAVSGTDGVYAATVCWYCCCYYQAVLRREGTPGGVRPRSVAPTMRRSSSRTSAWYPAYAPTLYPWPWAYDVCGYAMPLHRTLYATTLCAKAMCRHRTLCDYAMLERL